MSLPLPIEPPSLVVARGYSHGMLAPAGARLLAVAGQIAWNAEQQLVAYDFPSQFEQALRNVLAVVEAAGGEPAHVLQLTIYVTDKGAYIASLKAIGATYRELMGRHYPAMALVEVAALLEDRALVEIQALAAIP
jgi:enamine deaminase RidA (YjgF/YER057c/UK114 family)